MFWIWKIKKRKYTYFSDKKTGKIYKTSGFFNDIEQVWIRKKRKFLFF